jgi:ABC-2 type transport system ATP-binding protein
VLEFETCIVRLDGVSKSFGQSQVVRDVSFEVHCGQIFGLIGPSGCGKTTTIRLILGLYRPTSGTVNVHGLEPHRFPREAREDIGYMPQLFVLYPNLTVNQTLNFMASVYGLSREYRRERIGKVLELVGLQDHRKKPASRISGGMQRRLELACALLHEPSIIFFDEPTAGVDPVLRARFWEHFRALRDEGHTLFVTTQYVTEAEYCDKVALIDEGQLVALGSPKELRRKALGGEVIDFEAPGFAPASLSAVRSLGGVRRVAVLSVDRIRVYVDSAADALPHVLSALEDHDIGVSSAQEYNPSFDEIFVRLLEANHRPARSSSGGVTGAIERMPPGGADNVDAVQAHTGEIDVLEDQANEVDVNEVDADRVKAAAANERLARTDSEQGAESSEP